MSFLANLPIRKKLIYAFGALLGMVAILSVFVWIIISDFQKMQDEGAGRALDAQFLTEVSGTGAEMYRIIADAVINRDLEVTKTDWSKSKDESLADLSKLDSIVDTDQEKQWLEQAKKAHADFIAAFEESVLPALEGHDTISAEIRTADATIDDHIDEVEKYTTLMKESIHKESIAADSTFDAVARGTKVSLSIVLTLLALCSIGLVIVISRLIVTPINATVAMLKDIAEGEGDLTRRIDVKSTDEVGDLAKWFNTFVEKVQEMVREIADSATTITAATVRLSSSSSEIAASTEEMSTQASTVSAASEQAAANISTISAAAEEMSSEVQTVATAIEEMSASINEVSRNCAKESDTAQKANDKAKIAQEVMERLGVSAKAVGKVVSTIEEIADQTNLLALNATIEAASAGDAGKGFAVVANEVKELARQTAAATAEIYNQIEAIQKDTDNAIRAIADVAAGIADVNDISQTIVAAVEEQSATTNEISRSVGGASAAATSIAQNVNETAKGLAEVTRNITGIDRSAQSSANDIGTVARSSEELAELAKKLSNFVAQFKV